MITGLESHTELTISDFFAAHAMAALIIARKQEVKELVCAGADIGINHDVMNDDPSFAEAISKDAYELASWMVVAKSTYEDKLKEDLEE